MAGIKKPHDLTYTFILKGDDDEAKRILQEATLKLIEHEKNKLAMRGIHAKMIRSSANRLELVIDHLPGHALSYIPIRSQPPVSAVRPVDAATPAC